MKYIIELDDNQLLEYDKDTDTYFRTLYKAKGFNALVFDKNGLEKLTPLDKALSSELGEAYKKGLDEGKKQAKVQAHLDVCHDIERVAHGNYQKGLDDAWECARKIVVEKGSGGYTYEHLEEVLGTRNIHKILCNMTPSEVIAKLKAYEQQKPDEIKVGDIITDGKINYLVIDITDKSYIALQGTDFEPSYIGKDYINSYHNLHDSKDMQKIAEEINKAVKGERRDCYTCKHDGDSRFCDPCRHNDMWKPKEGAE